jgi:two-component system chemotaxis response regulator CheB
MSYRTDQPVSATPVTTICPECGGVLSELHEAGIVQWECRAGHRHSPDSLVNAQAEDVEAAMWAAVRALEDRRSLLERMAGQFESPHSISARSMCRCAAEAANQARAMREALTSADPSSLREIEPKAELDEMDDREERLAS